MPSNPQKIYPLVLAPKEHNISINVTIITNEFTLMKESLCIRQMRAETVRQYQVCNDSC